MLIDYCPKVVGQIREIKEICKAEQPEFDRIITEMDRLELNRFILSVDEINIVRLEKELGIIPLPGQSLEERRITVLIRSVRKNLSRREIENIIHKHSEEIWLFADYNKDELKVMVGDSVNNIPTIHKNLDEIIALNIFIFFSYETAVKSGIKDGPKAIRLKTKVKWQECETQHKTVKLSSTIYTEEQFNDVSLCKSKDLCYLDGSLFLDGSRFLDAEIIKEEI